MGRTLHPAVLALAVAGGSPAAWAQLSTEGPNGGAQANFVQSNWAVGLGEISDFRFLPDGRVVLCERFGQVKVRTLGGQWVEAGQFLVDTSNFQKGLLGVEVHPDFAKNGTLFFYLSAANAEGANDLDRNWVVSAVLSAANQLDVANKRVLVRNLRGPANNNGGGMAVGPDGRLYVGVGDTGCNSNTPPGTVQNYFATCLTNANGKVLRVFADGGIPSDNPLSGVVAATRCGNQCTDAVDAGSVGPPRKEIFAWGFRNPWRLWFDPKNGNLWVGDVGGIANEELSIVKAGRHYGFPFREGAEGQAVTQCTVTTPDSGSCIEPTYYCRHGADAPSVDGNCASIAGGLIVDSCTWPSGYRGLYYFGDNSTGQIWSLRLNATRDQPATVTQGSPRTPFAKIAGFLPVSFQVGPDQNLYVAALAGRIVKFEPQGPAFCAPDAGTGGGGGGGGGGTGGGSGGVSAMAPDSKVSNDEVPEETPKTGSGCSATGAASGFGCVLAFGLAGALRRRRRAGGRT